MESQTCQHFNLELLTSGTVRESISVVQVTQYAVFYYGSSGTLVQGFVQKRSQVLEHACANGQPLAND